MNCPKCGKELVDQDGVYLCEGCGARFRKKQPQPAESAPAESTPPAKSEETPAAKTETAQAPAEESAPAAEQTPVAAEESPAEPPAPTPQTEEQRRIAELERRLAEMESSRASAPKDSGEKGSFFKKAVSWVKGHKKATIIAAVAVVLIFALMIPLLVTFCGVRGVYVNVKNPREYYRFGVSSVEYCENVDNPEMMMEGKYSISGNKITFTVEDGLFGEMSDTSSFQKLDGNKKIQIGDDVYEYVGYSIGGKVTLTFDANGGIGSTEVEVEMGKRLSELPPNPGKDNCAFGGWKVSSDVYFNENAPIWKDTVLIAEWEKCNHAGMKCNEAVCTKCGTGKQEVLSEISYLDLAHSLNDECVCTRCGIKKHSYNSAHICLRCGTSALALSGSTLTKVQTDYLGALTIPDTVTTIGNDAFRGCSSITEITIPDSVTSIGWRAFSGCTGLTSITIPNSVTRIREEAFSGCSSLTSVTIPDSVTSIDDSAFRECSSLTSVSIPDCVTRIRGYVFYGCSSLTSVTIPGCVTSIGGDAFFDCAELESITFQGTKAQWKAISKGVNWNFYTGDYTIHCTDGDISKS